ncbi:MAG TPA: sugar transferase [Candidatus Didemnitutus sp.]|nr:sugar transferase [Candidatus Didemnitutus sp.]
MEPGSNTPDPSDAAPAESAHAQLHRRNVRAYVALSPSTRRIDARTRTPTPMVSLRNPLPTWKRALDLSACFAGIPLLALGTLTLVVMSRWTSPGPVIFLEERVGFAGKRFRTYRFRTRSMRPEPGSNRPVSSPVARSVPGGKFIRRLHFDRLPQLLNVLRGEMSLVGPQPCLPVEYQRLTSWQRAQCTGLPGITGLGQVARPRGVRVERRVRLDIYYTRNLSLAGDLGILARTLPVILSGKRRRETKD